MPSSNFSQKAKDYNSQASVQSKHATELVISTLPHLSQGNLKIADLGCGTGAVGKSIKQHLQSFNLNNCDISDTMIMEAKKELGPNNCRYTNTSIPEDSDYDLILSNFALQWYENLEKTLNECIQKLKPEGVLAIALPIQGSFSSLKNSFKHVDAEEFLFQFPPREQINNSLKNCTTLEEEIISEDLTFENSVQLFKNLHTIGANQTDKRLATSKFRKLIRYHDELFQEKIIVTYKILKLIAKRVNP